MTGSSDAIFLFPVRAIKLLDSDVLQLGDFGFLVQRLQETLIHSGFYDGPIDGYFSYETERSIRQVQRHYRLKITGQCDATIWQALQAMGESER